MVARLPSAAEYEERVLHEQEWLPHLRPYLSLPIPEPLALGQPGDGEHVITDPAKFEEYRARVGPLIASFGGRYLTKGSTHRLPEGGHWAPERMVIVEFPDMLSLEAWYQSREYQPLIALRKQCTSDMDMLFMLEGA